VDTSRTSKRSERARATNATSVAFAAIVAFASLACGASVTTTPVTAVTLPDPPRQPDGVVIEPTRAVPEADERAPAEGVVALRAPLPREAVTTIVHMLFRAFMHEDIEALQATLTEDAVLLTPARGVPEKRSLLDQWRARLKSFDYTRLAGTELVEEAKIERYAYEDLGVPGAPERPAEMKRGEILARFPVPTPRAGSEQLFGDEMTLLLRREGRRYKIAAFGESDAP